MFLSVQKLSRRSCIWFLRMQSTSLFNFVWQLEREELSNMRLPWSGIMFSMRWTIPEQRTFYFMHVYMFWSYVPTSLSVACRRRRRLVYNKCYQTRTQTFMRAGRWLQILGFEQPHNCCPICQWRLNTCQPSIK